METETTKRVGAGWRNWKKCSGVLCVQKDASETAGEGIQDSDQASNAIWDRNVGYNEETRKTNWGDRDEDATMDVRSDTQRQDQ